MNEPYVESIQPLGDGRTRCTIMIPAGDVEATRREIAEWHKQVAAFGGFTDAVDWQLRGHSLVSRDVCTIQFTLPPGVAIQKLIGITEAEITEAQVRSAAEWREHWARQGTAVVAQPLAMGTARAMDAPRPLAVVKAPKKPTRPKPDYYALREQYIGGDDSALPKMLKKVTRSSADSIIDTIRAMPDPPPRWSSLEDYLREKKLPAAVPAADVKRRNPGLAAGTALIAAFAVLVSFILLADDKLAGLGTLVPAALFGYWTWHFGRRNPPS